MHNRSTFHAILIKHNYYVKSDDICIVHEHHTRASFNRLLLFIAEIIFLLCFRGSFLQREFFYTGTFSKKTLQIKKKCAIISKSYAGMAELADAHGSGPCESDFMQVQVLLSAPNSRNPNLVPIGEGFGFLLYLDYPNFNNKIR